jgi:hypothetical protein
VNKNGQSQYVIEIVERTTATTTTTITTTTRRRRLGLIE